MTKKEFNTKEKAWNVEGGFLCYKNCYSEYADNHYSASNLVWIEVFKEMSLQEKGWFCKSCVSKIDQNWYNIKQGETLVDFIRANFDLVVQEGYI